MITKVSKAIMVSMLIVISSCSSTKEKHNETRQYVKDNEETKPRRDGPEGLFADMDNNNDGKLSREEVKGPLKENFSKVDANADGYLSKDELKAARPKRHGRR